VRLPARVGIVGCGVISRRYAENSLAFESFDVVSCADSDPARAELLANEHGLAAASIGGLLDDDSLDVVLNLTPAPAHAAVSLRALEAGKHVYTEKPLAASLADALALVEAADRRGLRVGSAPDTFLSGAYQAARTLLDEGRIGEPLHVSAAFVGEGPDAWHPDADGFYRPGTGPLFDMGPYYLTAIAALLGPVSRVAAFASTRRQERVFGAGPRAGESFAVSTPTHVTAALELAGGSSGTLLASFEADGGPSSAELTIRGTRGVLSLPDPNRFDGALQLRLAGGEWEPVEYASRGDRDARGIGLHDLVESIAAGRPHRASGRLALHVLDVAASILASAEEGRALAVASSCDPIEPLPVQVG
jgi:predicted dehydrogenase